MQAADVACSAAGHARFNVANALAASAALIAVGMPLESIRHGLATFTSDARSNPLRLNMFDVAGVLLVVDYAHNPVAYAALGTMARALAGSGSRLVGVVTSPGDRRDVDLQAVGRVCAQHFDTVIVYESASRGRAHGETAGLICAGAAAAAAAQLEGSACTVMQENDVHRAVQRALALCQPGDIMAFACGTSLTVLVDSLRPIDPASADRIALQIA